MTIVLVISSCTDINKSSLQIISLFTDSDLNLASIQTTNYIHEIVGTNIGTNSSDFPDEKELPPLSNVNTELTTQTTIPEATGFIYYIENNPNTSQPWRIFRYDQSKDQNLLVYSGAREIQSVTGSLDGNIIIASMRQTTTSPIDFEIWRFILNPETIQRLTTNLADDINVSTSSSTLKVVWEQPVDGIASIIIRNYVSATLTGNFTESVLKNTFPQREPSISANGHFIIFVQDLDATTNRISRFDSNTNTYLSVFRNSEPLHHPSISNDGNIALYLWKRSYGDIIRKKTINSRIFQTVVKNLPSTLEHPSITPNAKFITYGVREGISTGNHKLYIKNLKSGQTAQQTSPIGPIRHFGMSWAMPFLKETKLLRNEPMDTNDLFGSSIAINGDYLIVGIPRAKHDTDGNGIQELIGAADIYKRDSSGAWSFVKRLQANDASEDDSFGSKVAIFGDIAVVGAPGEDHDTDNIIGDEQSVGAVYIFQKDFGGIDQWGQVKKVIASDSRKNDAFGSSLAISNLTLIIGAPSQARDVNNDGITDCGDGGIDTECTIGAAYIFQNQNNNQWEQVRKLTHLPGRNGDSLGTSVGIFNSTAVVGAILADGKSFREGAAFMFERDSGGINNWGLVKTLIGKDSIFGDHFGSSIAISDSRLVIGADSDNRDIDGNAGHETAVGAAYIFEKNSGGNSNWGEVKKLVGSDGYSGDYFGNNITISTSTVVVGAYYKLYDIDSNGEFERFVGAAYMFEKDQGGPGNWGEVTKLIASDISQDCTFGRSVAISNSTIFIGAPNCANNSGVKTGGAIYIFE